MVKHQFKSSVHSFIGLFSSYYWILRVLYKFWTQVFYHIHGSQLFSSYLCFVFFFSFYFTILYWFCHISTWIHHGCTCAPHPEPPPTALPIPSLWVIPVHQPQASCILHRTWTGNSFLIWYYTCFLYFLLELVFFALVNLFSVTEIIQLDIRKK